MQPCMAGSEWGVIGQKVASQVIVQLHIVQHGRKGWQCLGNIIKQVSSRRSFYPVLCPQTIGGHEFLSSLPFTKPKTKFQSKSLDPYITLDLKQEGALPGLEPRSVPHDIHVLSCQLLCKSKPNEEDRSNVKDGFVSS